MNNFFNKLYLKRVFSCFDFIGTPEEIDAFKEFLTMLSTTPTGRVILDNMLKMDPTQEAPEFTKMLFKLPHASIGKAIFKEAFHKKINLFFHHDEESSSDGAFYPETNSIELFYQDIYDPTLSDKERLEAKASRVIALAHELQHAVMANAIRKITLGKRSKKDTLLANRILEAAAYYSDNKVKKELAQQHPHLRSAFLSEKIQRYAHMRNAAENPCDNQPLRPARSPEVDKNIFFHEAYLGQNKQVEGSIQLEEAAEEKKKARQEESVPSAKPPIKGTKKDFWDGIEEVLKEMHVDIPRYQLLETTWRSTIYPIKKRSGDSTKRPRTIGR